MLNEKSAAPVYPNRLHALLSRERGVNESTLKQLEDAAARIAISPADFVRVEKISAEARRLWPLLVASMRPTAALADHLGLPIALAEDVIRRCGFSATGHHGVATAPTLRTPDWSFQDDAERLCRRALQRGRSPRIGMVVPTGGGKTRIALRIALKWLAEHAEARVIWITHQRNLREQAHRELQQLLLARTDGLPEDAAQLLAQRIEVVMVHKLRERLASHDGTPLLAIVDEAHHAAGATYQPVFETAFALPALFLTATPNRTDGLPLGIDAIAYSITYRELADRGVILLPQFQDFAVKDFDWTPPPAPDLTKGSLPASLKIRDPIADLADSIIDRAADDFTKTLVLAPRIDRVEDFYAALIARLDEELKGSGHPLNLDDVGFIHGSGNSLKVSSEEFLATFREKPRAIYVSAQLLLEGFNDPAINAVVITYASTSMTRLMQAAGRCVRWTLGKTAAFVLQARNDTLAYHFEHRWLYQEISDRFRPQIYDVAYSDAADLARKASDWLHRHHVVDAERTLAAVRAVPMGATCRFLLTGLPYFGAKEDFGTAAAWGAFLEHDGNSTAFRWIFNDFCARGGEAADPVDFLHQYALRFGFTQSYADGTAWRQYSDILMAIHRAAVEVAGGSGRTADGPHRDFTPAAPTTWLEYVTFRYEPAVDPAFTAFVLDCHNRESLLQSLVANTPDFALAVKLPLPGGSSEGYLLSSDAAARFRDSVGRVRAIVAANPPDQRMKVYRAAVGELSGIAQLPIYAIERLEYFLNPQHEATLTFALSKERTA